LSDHCHELQADARWMQQPEPAPRVAHHRAAPGSRRQWWRPLRQPVAAITSLAARLGPRLHGRLKRSSTRPLLPELAAISCFLFLLWASILIALNHEYSAAEASAVQSTGNLARAF
jgi:hypothetical protein